MTFTADNQFWKARAKHGRDKIFSDPNVLWESACEYFEWVDNNPLYEDRLVSFQGESKHEPVAKMRAMTLDGLWLFLGIGKSTWYDYKERTDYSEVISRIEQVVYQQKFSGAAADLLNANIISRDLGLADKKEVKQEVSNMSEDEINNRIEALINELKS